MAGDTVTMPAMVCRIMTDRYSSRRARRHSRQNVQSRDASRHSVIQRIDSLTALVQSIVPGPDDQDMNTHKEIVDAKKGFAWDVLINLNRLRDEIREEIAHVRSLLWEESKCTRTVEDRMLCIERTQHVLDARLNSMEETIEIVMRAVKKGLPH